MKKFLIILLILCFSLTGCGKNDTTNNQEENNNYTASRITTTNNINNNIEIKDNVNTETEIASFSTKIYTPNDSARQNNIKITCSELNETIVKSRRNFFIL